MIVDASSDDDKRLFHNKTQYNPGPDFRGIKFEHDDKTIAMVGYDGWTLNAVHMHVWIEDFGRAFKGGQFLYEVFNYAFTKREVAFAVTPAHNTASLRFQQFLGFSEIARLKDGWAIGDDMVISELRKHDCVWIKPINEPIRSTEQ